MKYLSFILPLFLIGCGGGGGGGGPSTPGYTNIITQPINNYPYPEQPILIIDDNKTIVSPSPDSNNTLNSFINEEYLASNALFNINSYKAYEEGYTGLNTTIAIVDSGIDKNHFDLSSNIVNGISFVGEILVNDDVYYKPVYFDQLESIALLNSGSGYNSAPSISIVGDGTGATAEAILNQNGTIKEILLTNSGTGYSYANIIVNNEGTTGSGLSAFVYLGGDDNSGHGTFVAGLAGASKEQYDETTPYNNTIHGVAYNVNIMPIKVFTNDGKGFIPIVQEGIKYAYEQNVEVINLSLGTNYSYGITSSINKNVYLNALQNDSTFVIAAGNEGLSCMPVNGSIEGRCSFPAALPWISGYENLLTQEGGWIIVGSVDSNNLITSWTNKAGVTKSNYLVAPGENLISTDLNNSYSMGSGTSYSAPLVSGTVALMKEKYPHLTGNQISQILFQTATDLGAPGVDSIYGNGLLNIEQAFAPIGQLSITPTNSTPTTYVGGMVLGKSFGKLNLSSLNNTIALDSYGRDYQVNISNSVSTTDLDSFSFNDFYIFKEKNLLVGIDQVNERALIGFNLDTLSFLYSQTDDLYGSSSSGLFGLKNEKTHYFSLRDTFSFLGFNSGYELNYNIGTASPSSNSLIESIEPLEGYGYRVFLERDNIGVIYGEDSSIRRGNITFKIPTSRNLDGSLNYSNVNIDSYQKPQKEISIYKKFVADYFSLTTGITKKLNAERLAYDENEVLSYFKLNYIF
jgi:subtilisin family serine protease